MECSRIHDILGPYLDGELATAEAAVVDAHLRACPACAAELARMKTLLGQLAAADMADQAQPPADAWARIEQRLASSPTRPAVVRYWRRPLTAAASLAVLLGLSTLVAVWVNESAQPATAAIVDYSLLLDGVAKDVDGAVDRFFQHYQAAPLDAPSVAAAAPGMSFRLPDELPGGFKREGIYRLRFGTAIGIAARYRRDHEPLVIFFHPPMDKTQMGVHRQSCCHVAGREGQRVEVGPWQLIHFTDPSTCHCLLSQLDEAGQAAVFAAVAPGFPNPTTRP